MSCEFKTLPLPFQTVACINLAHEFQYSQPSVGISGCRTPGYGGTQRRGADHSMLYFVRDLSMPGFTYQQGVLETVPQEYMKERVLMCYSWDAQNQAPNKYFKKKLKARKQRVILAL